MNHNKNIPEDLQDRLRDDAMTERPSFSPEIHHRIMRHVRNSPPPQMKLGRWIEVIAATILIAVGALTLTRAIHAVRTRANNSGLHIAGNVGPTPQVALTPPISFPLTLNIGGIFSAKLWPPELTMRLPVSTQSHSPQSEPLPPQSYDPPGSPEWLFAQIQQPATSAQIALADLIPPDMRSLANLAKLRQ